MAPEGGRILIVDDTRLNRMVLVRGLTAQGHSVATAENGRQALDLLRAQPFDVVLLDILMPELDGYETLALIKDDASLRHMPVIMISAVDEMDSVIRCIGMGAADYLPKPFNAALLEARINSSLAGKRLRDLELEYIEQAGRVADAAGAVELGTFEPESLAGVAGRTDALGRLARVFLRMAEEVHLREQRLRRQLERLHHDMEEMRRAATEPLWVHLPMDRRQALARGEGLPDRALGAALFADLSGSTPLAEGLARELGLERGAEEISRHLNRVFGALIDEVERYGGSVIGFAGDAITCWFDGDDGLRATTSALAMQDAMGQFTTVSTPTGTAFSLGIKAAVAVGPVRRFLVGDPAIQQIEILAGQTLRTLSSADHLAGKGEVVVHAQVVERAVPSLEVRGWRSETESGERFALVAGGVGPVAAAPWPDLGADTLTPAQCRPWVPGPVYEISRSGANPFLAELRPVASLFLQFTGIDYDNDEQAPSKLDAYVRWVQGIVEGHDASLLRVSDGDKGSTLHIAFGAPTAHEDDAARAIDAALELASTPAELAYMTGTQIGVAQGLMWTGAYGGRTRRKYGVLGDKANLAARLMQAAAGGILCDDVIFQGAVSRFAFEALAPIAVKGKDETVRIYRPSRRPPECARSAAGDGSLPVCGDRRGSSAPRPSGDIPEPADPSVVGGQLDRLSPCERLALKLASVVGQSFGHKILHDIFPVEFERPRLGEILRGLEEAGLLESVPLGASVEYRFRSVSTWESVYGTLLYAQRRQLHRAVAEWYETAYADGLCAHYPTLAHHWWRADDPAKAIDYLERAGREAASRGALEEAEGYLAESLQLSAGSAVLSGSFHDEGEGLASDTER